MTDPPAPVKVDVTVAGHTVIVEAAEPLDVVAAKALDLFRETAGYARSSPVGFAAPPAHVELSADP
ncbi:hypothetical protein GA0074692_6878 [Micromonospora pallida]|uniref:Uncharacterized protein n=1 Tax=Micromonospora pallida TaxID=145854 RepID=A0A1C6RHC1_9ACTN|nr:hypothetical protein [Micromonospora pallida]SCL16391.1 hypothetical protein GA0074692_0018 [Micromonospora pallida]SCL43428.1 hypothetical protein GA0074692_6878 [Micromonospora pallida]